jgi:hypothetical protein
MTTYALYMFTGSVHVHVYLQNFLATKEITQTEFLQEIHVNPNSFQRFMSYKGMIHGQATRIFSVRYHRKICYVIDFKFEFEFNLSMTRMTGNSGVDNGTYWGALQYFHDNGMLRVSKKRKSRADD